MPEDIDTSVHASAKEEHLPASLAYTIEWENAVTILGDQTLLTILVEIPSNSPLVLNEPTENRIAIGVRYFEALNVGGQFAKGNQILEQRPFDGVVSLTPNAPCKLSFVLDTIQLPSHFYLDIGLVAEGRYWLSDLGHISLLQLVSTRQVIVAAPSSENAQIKSLDTIAREMHEYKRSSDAIIFGLMHQLKQLSDD